MAGELSPLQSAIPTVVNASDRETRYPPATRIQNQRVFRLDTQNQERWNGSSWLIDFGPFSASQPPGGGRTVATVTQYLADNATFNVKDFGAAGDGSTVDTVAIQATITAAEAVTSTFAASATVYFPPGTYLVSSTLTASQGTVFCGAGSRASRIVSSVAGNTFLFGNISNLSYGCGVHDLSILLTNAAGVGLNALCTAGWFARDLYIEGVQNSTTQGVVLDGGNAANLFSRLDNIICNHVGIGYNILSTGSSYVTTVEMVGCRALCDTAAGSVGLKIRPVNAYSIRVVGGNFEECAVGIDCTGVTNQFMGVRFEANTNDVLLNAGAEGNLFVGCSGIGNNIGLVNNSGNLTNCFLANYIGPTLLPNNHMQAFDQLTSTSTVIFGSDPAVFTKGTTGAIANNGTATIPVSGHYFRLSLTENAQNTAAEVLITPAAGTPITLGTVTSSGYYTVTLGTASKINFGYSAGVLTIENKTGAPFTGNYVLLQVES